MYKSIKRLAAIVVISVTLGGCGYSGVAAVGDAAIVARNDWILFGLLRKVYVCRITPTGLTQCSSSEDP
jgi:hypothetical protein